jgi:hypothetical protein
MENGSGPRAPVSFPLVMLHSSSLLTLPFYDGGPFDV